MTIDNKLPIFDGHNDVLQSIYLPKTGKPRSFFERTAEGHIDLPRMRQGGFAGGFFAVFVPSNSATDGFPGARPDSAATAYEMPLPAALDLTYARDNYHQGNGQLVPSRSGIRGADQGHPNRR